MNKDTALALAALQTHKIIRASGNNEHYKELERQSLATSTLVDAPGVFFTFDYRLAE